MEVDSSPSMQRKKVHIPFCDVDDLAFRNRHDPNYVASITNLMQVPSTIRIMNGQNGHDHENKENLYNGSSLSKPFSHTDTAFPMDIPEKLTADTILRDRHEEFDSYAQNRSNHNNNADNDDDLDYLEQSTPKKFGLTNGELNYDEELCNGNLAKTPQVAAELFKRMKPRRQSIEIDLNQEVRYLRDRLNRLEHECQLNAQTSKLFYAVFCGYLFVKTVSWLINTK